VKNEPDRVVEYRLPRLAVWLMVAMGLIAFGASTVAGVAVAINYERTNQIVATRTGSRIYACNVNRTFAMAHNKLVQRNKDLLSQTFNSPNHPPRTDAYQESIDAYLAKQDAEYDKSIVPVPKCDPASVKATYSKVTK